MGLNVNGGLFEQDFDFDGSGRGLVASMIENAAREETQVTDSGAASTGSTSTIYTVAAGKVLWVVQANLNVVNNHASSSSAGSITIGGQAFSLGARPQTNNTTAFVFAPMPVKVAAAGTVTVTGPGTGTSYASFVGWIEDA